MIPPLRLLRDTPIPGINEFVENAIANIRCVEDITPELIASIRREIRRNLAIPAFPVTMNKFLEWQAKQPPGSLQGFDYDARQGRLLLRPQEPDPACGALKGILTWFHTAIDRLGDDNSRSWSIVQGERMPRLLLQLHLALVSDKILAYMLTNNIDMIKRPQTALINANQRWPLMVVHVENNETEEEVLDNAKQWLYGTNREVQLVIVITIHEQDAPPYDGSWLHGVRWSNPGQLEELIYGDESKKSSPSMVGPIIADVWLLSRRNCSQNATRLPPFPFYKLRCELQGGQSTGSVSYVWGASCVDSRNNLLLEYVEAPFPFQAFDEFLRSRCRRVAIRIWNNYQQRHRQMEANRAEHTDSE